MSPKPNGSPTLNLILLVHNFRFGRRAATGDSRYQVSEFYSVSIPTYYDFMTPSETRDKKLTAMHHKKRFCSVWHKTQQAGANSWRVGGDNTTQEPHHRQKNFDIFKRSSK